MDQILRLRVQVDRLSRQSTSDFQFTMLALKDMGAVFRLQTDELGKRIQGLGREMDEGFHLLAGRMKLQEQRVAGVLQAVDNSLQVYENHELRLQALEGTGQPPA